MISNRMLAASVDLQGLPMRAAVEMVDALQECREAGLEKIDQVLAVIGARPGTKRGGVAERLWDKLADMKPAAPKVGSSTKDTLMLVAAMADLAQDIGALRQQLAQMIDRA